jgi:uncharacterized protein GlcG (DUF336 family)
MPAAAYRKPAEGSNLASLACRPGQPPSGIHASYQERLIVYPGGVPLEGVPLEAAGTVVGAAGDSAVGQDQQVSEAATRSQGLPDDDQNYARRAKEALGSALMTVENDV